MRILNIMTNNLNIMNENFFFIILMKTGKKDFFKEQSIKCLAQDIFKTPASMFFLVFIRLVVCK